MPHPLRAIVKRDDANTSVFPWTLPVFAGFEELEFKAPVTFIVGENGCGKSTLLEAVAMAAGLNPEGGTRNLNFTTRETESEMVRGIRLVWNHRTQWAFFLRAESFFNMLTAYEQIGPGPKASLDTGMHDLHAMSHGQQFVATLNRRFSEDGFYLMDEPESALSFTSELALLSTIHRCVAAGAQFIIATHSPILVTYPGAVILEMADDGIQPVELTDALPFRETKAFLDAPDRYLRFLLEEGE